jgi:hypothetical protein
MVDVYVDTHRSMPSSEHPPPSHAEIAAATDGIGGGSKLSGGAIAGIVIAAVLVALLLASLLLLVWRERRGKPVRAHGLIMCLMTLSGGDTWTSK